MLTIILLVLVILLLAGGVTAPADWRSPIGVLLLVVLVVLVLRLCGVV